MASILVIDDDRAYCNMVVRYLGDEGFRATAVHSGPDGLNAINVHNYDLLILDLMMPGMSGKDVLQSIRSTPSRNQSMPILMLTARDEEVDRIIGLELGADDYVQKPCSLRELAARIRAVLRRTSGTVEAATNARYVEYGDLVFDMVRRTASHAGNSLNLTGSEFAVLLCLAQGDGRPVSKDSISQSVHGRKYGATDRSIDMHVSNLRRKLAAGDVENVSIRTMRARGYWLALEA